MKSTLHSSLRGLSLGAIVVASGALASAQTVTDWYLVQSNVSDQNWNNTNSSQTYKYWADSPSITNYTGFESRYATAMDAAATYHVIGTSSATRDVRTGSTTNTFQGGKLILENEFSRLLIRSAGSNTSTIANLESKGGQFITAISGINNLTISTFTVSGSAATLFTASTGTAENNRTHNLNITTLVGGGNIAFSSANATSRYTFSIGDASAYTGAFLLTSGELTFTSSFATAGSLTLTSGTFHLTNDITVSALTVSGTALTEGSYTVAQLAGYAASGLTIDGNALITVATIPEPAHAVLGLAGIAAAFAVWSRRRR